MSENLVTKDLQKLDPGSELVTLFELEYSKGDFIYFTAGLNENLGEVQMRDYSNNAQINTYVAIPAQVQGIEYKNDGAISRPTVSIGNATTVFSSAIGTIDYQTFLGLKFIKRTTLKKYLYGESGDSNPPTEFPRQVWNMDRIKARSKTSVQIELVAPFDMETVQIPARKIYSDRCSFKYQGASPGIDRWKKEQSGCKWHLEGHIYGINGVKYTVFANLDDEYIVPSSVTFANYTSGAVNLNAYYKTTKSSTRFNANGSTSSVTINNYWQATRSTTVTPQDNHSDWSRVRVFNDYSTSNTYYAYTDDRLNDYAKPTSGTEFLWQAKITHTNEAQEFGNYWKRGDLCGKRLSSCQCRSGFSPISPGTATSRGKATKVTTRALPFGGFPGARKFK